MILLLYILPIVAWLTFIYVQHHQGDRPTTYVWWAFMSALGVFEYGKCVFYYFDALPANSLAFLFAIIAGGSALTYHAHRVWNAPVEGTHRCRRRLAGAISRCRS